MLLNETEHSNFIYDTESRQAVTVVGASLNQVSFTFLAYRHPSEKRKKDVKSGSNHLAMPYHISDHLQSPSCQANRHFKLINAVIETARRTGGYFVSNSILYETEQWCLKMGCIQGKQASWKCCSHYFKIILFSLRALSRVGFQFPSKCSFQHIFDPGLKNLTFSFCKDWIHNGPVKNKGQMPQIGANWYCSIALHTDLQKTRIWLRAFQSLGCFAISCKHLLQF